MNNQEPQIYQQLRQLTEDAVHFLEVRGLIAEVHKIFIVPLSTGWGVDAQDGAIHTEFDTFGEAFKFVMGLLEVKA